MAGGLVVLASHECRDTVASLAATGHVVFVVVTDASLGLIRGKGILVLSGRHHDKEML